MSGFFYWRISFLFNWIFQNLDKKIRMLRKRNILYGCVNIVFAGGFISADGNSKNRIYKEYSMWRHRLVMRVVKLKKIFDMTMMNNLLNYGLDIEVIRRHKKISMLSIQEWLMIVYVRCHQILVICMCFIHVHPTKSGMLLRRLFSETYLWNTSNCEPKWW